MDSVKFFKKTFLLLIISISSISVYSQNKFFNNDKTKLGFDFGVGCQRINNNSLKLDLLNVKYTYNLYLFQFQYYYSLYDKEKLSIETLIQPQYNFAKYTFHDDSEEILTAHEAGINIGFLIRKKFKLSQAALASIFNISPSTVRKWEQGNKKPAGASKKLLNIVERKGLEALI